MVGAHTHIGRSGWQRCTLIAGGLARLVAVTDSDGGEFHSGTAFGPGVQVPHTVAASGACVDMCVDMCIDTCFDTCSVMCLDICLVVCLDVCLGMCFDMYLSPLQEIGQLAKMVWERAARSSVHCLKGWLRALLRPVLPKVAEKLEPMSQLKKVMNILIANLSVVCTCRLLNCV